MSASRPEMMIDRARPTFSMISYMIGSACCKWPASSCNPHVSIASPTKNTRQTVRNLPAAGHRCSSTATPPSSSALWSQPIVSARRTSATCHRPTMSPPPPSKPALSGAKRRTHDSRPRSSAAMMGPTWRAAANKTTKTHESVNRRDTAQSDKQQSRGITHQLGRFVVETQASPGNVKSVGRQTQSLSGPLNPVQSTTLQQRNQVSVAAAAGLGWPDSPDDPIGARVQVMTPLLPSTARPTHRPVWGKSHLTPPEPGASLTSPAPSKRASRSQLILSPTDHPATELRCSSAQTTHPPTTLQISTPKKFRPILLPLLFFFFNQLHWG